MPNLNPAFASIVTFQDFVDTFRANPMGTSVTRNDLVRAWNILVHARTNPSAIVTLRYAEINVSQSSVRTIVSKLNQIFRHVGLMAASQKLRIGLVDFYHAEVSIEALHTAGVVSSLGWNLGTAWTRGRRQDRTTERHVDGHRNRRVLGERLAPLDAPQVTNQENIGGFSIAGILDGFNPFEGLGSDILATLRSEAV